MVNYWIAVASRTHVLHGVEGAFCQVCHGKEGPLKCMKGGDWIAYYSSKEVYGGKESCKRFTALGRIAESAPYQVTMEGSFAPWRRKVEFFPNVKEAAIEPLLNSLSFLSDKRRWGLPFRRGCFTIAREDFAIIAEAMGKGCREAPFF